MEWGYTFASTLKGGKRLYTGEPQTNWEIITCFFHRSSHADGISEKVGNRNDNFTNNGCDERKKHGAAVLDLKSTYDCEPRDTSKAICERVLPKKWLDHASCSNAKCDDSRWSIEHENHEKNYSSGLTGWTGNPSRPQYLHRQPCSETANQIRSPDGSPPERFYADDIDIHVGKMCELQQET